MSHQRFPWLALAALIVVGLLIAGGTAIHRRGWTQGYVMGRLAAGGEDGAAGPYLPYGYPGRHVGFAPALCGLGPLLTVGLLLLALVAAGRLFRFRAWKKAAGPEGERWARHWARHWRHGPTPPWCWGREEPAEGTDEGAEPNAETGHAEAES